jgi:hypothetical protein
MPEGAGKARPVRKDEKAREIAEADKTGRPHAAPLEEAAP